MSLSRDGDLTAAFGAVDGAGYQIHVHTIGDGAVKYTLDAIEQTQGGDDKRHSLAHVQLIKPEDVSRMWQLGVAAHMSPYWMVMFDTYSEYYLPYLGEERASNTYPQKSMFDAGVKVTVASDLPTTEFDIMTAVYNGMTRSAVGGEQLPQGDECVGLEQMLEAATMNGAWANFLDGEIGSIEVGKRADIVVLDKNLFDIDVEDIPGVEVEMTFFEGKRVH